MLLTEPIAVLGGGNAGCCMAADLSLSGYKVNFYEHPQFKDVFKPILDAGAIELESGLTGQSTTAKIHKVTMDMKEALKDAKLVNLVVPAGGHRVFFETMVPCLRDGQVIVIYPDNYGSLQLRRLLKERAPSLRVVIYGTTTMIYGTRRIGPTKVKFTHGIGPTMRKEKQPFKREVGIAALPATETTGLKELQELWSGIRVAQNVISVGLSNHNIALHPLSSLLNAGRIEYSKGEFYLYREGMTPSVLRADQYLSDEMKVVGKAYDSEVRHFAGASVLEAVGPICGDDAVDKRVGATRGPESLQSRYLTEDIPFGLFGASQLAKKAGVKTPITDATIAIGEIVCNFDVHKIGCTLESMGLAELSKDEVVKYVQG